MGIKDEPEESRRSNPTGVNVPIGHRAACRALGVLGLLGLDRSFLFLSMSVICRTHVGGGTVDFKGGQWSNSSFLSVKDGVVRRNRRRNPLERVLPRIQQAARRISSIVKSSTLENQRDMPSQTGEWEPSQNLSRPFSRITCAVSRLCCF